MPYEIEFTIYITKKYRNFGILLISCNKSSYMELKNYLKNRLFNFKRFLNSIQTTITKKRKKFTLKLIKEKVISLPKYFKVIILNPFCLEISNIALEKIY